MFENILFVCVGNICRSPVAEALLKYYFQTNNRQHQVSSCGLAALVNEPAADFSCQVLLEQKNIDISSHKARQIAKEMVLNSDLILVMEEGQIKQIQHQFPFAIGRVHLLGKWQQNKEILDPYKKPKVAFETMLTGIDNCLNDWINKFWK